MNKYVSIILVVIPMLTVTFTGKYKLFFSFYMIGLGLVFYFLKINFNKIYYRKYIVYNLGTIPGLLAFIIMYYLFLYSTISDFWFLLSIAVFAISLVRVKYNDFKN